MRPFLIVLCGCIVGFLADRAWLLAEDHHLAGVSVKKLLAQEVPAEVHGKPAKITAVEVEYQPGASSTKHRHPGPVFVYVLEGAVVSQVEDETAKTYQQGDCFCETGEKMHLQSENASPTNKARILAVFLADKTETQLTQPVGP